MVGTRPSCRAMAAHSRNRSGSSALASAAWGVQTALAQRVRIAAKVVVEAVLGDLSAADQLRDGGRVAKLFSAGADNGNHFVFRQGVPHKKSHPVGWLAEDVWT